MQKRQTRLPGLAGLFFGLVGVALLAACVVPGPTPLPLAPTSDVVGTVTAQAIPVVATQTALVASLTQAVQAKATLTAQAETQAALATGTTQVQAVDAQVATATALARAVVAQAATATSLAAANATALAPNTAPAIPTTIVVTATGSAMTTVTPVPTLQPIPTLALAPAAAGPCVTVDAALASITAKAAEAGLDLGCPTGPAVAVQGALQEFFAIKANAKASTSPRSLMIWRADTQAIYLVQGQDARASQGSLSAFTDQYQDSDPDIPPACEGLKAPTGYEKPVRGFGLVWCANHLNNSVGWPNRRETAANLRIQPTRNGLLLRVAAPEVSAGYLVALDHQSHRVAASMFVP